MKGPPRQAHPFATDINLWQISFDWIRCRCLISKKTFICNVFSWNRLADLNPGPLYETTSHPHAHEGNSVIPICFVSSKPVRTHSDQWSWG